MQYNQHFFVNTNGANGPESHWIHPNEQERQKAPQSEKAQSYAPPTGAPPSNGSGTSLPSPGGQPSSSYNAQQQQQSMNNDQREGKKGFLGKLFNNSNKPSQQQQYRPQQGYGGGGYPQRKSRNTLFVYIKHC